MRLPVFGLVFALCIILSSILSIGTVRKINAIGGSSYEWEYIPPGLFLALGIYLLAYWLGRI